MENKKYTPKELKVGMKVKISELTDILDTYIMLVDTERISSTDAVGTLAYIGHD